MKKQILSILMALAVGVCVAQNANDNNRQKVSRNLVQTEDGDTYRRFTGNVMAGMNTSQISFPDVELLAGGRTGWYAGASMQYNFSEFYGLRLGCDYSLQRAYMVDPNDVFGNKAKFNQTLITVPLTFQFGENKMGEGSKYFTANFGFGGYLTYNLTKSGTAPAGMSYGDEHLIGGGLQCSVNASIAHFYYEVVLRGDLSDLGFTTNGLSSPASSMLSVMVGIGYMF